METNNEMPKDALPWGLEGIAHRVGKLEALVAQLEDNDASLEKELKDHGDLSELKVAEVSERLIAAEKKELENRRLIREMQITIKDMKVLLEAWNKIKSTVNVLHTIGETIKWLTIVGAAAGLLWAFVLRGYPTTSSVLPPNSPLLNNTSPVQQEPLRAPK